MKALDGKVCLVTGGSRGIGLATARALVAEGAQVAICGRDQRALDDARNVLGSSALAIRCDVRHHNEVERLFRQIADRLGGLDVLVNNAGVGIFAPVGELTPEQWQQVLETNLTGVFYCCHEAIPLMRKRGGGFIINISSLAGKNAFAGGAAYNASKFGLNGFSEALMLDVRYENIRVSYVMPGSVETEFAAGSGPAEWKLQAEDVARVVLDLICLPQRALASRVEIRPLKPPKK